jgi:hypothetical protein
MLERKPFPMLRCTIDAHAGNANAGNGFVASAGRSRITEWAHMRIARSAVIGV